MSSSPVAASLGQCQIDLPPRQLPAPPKSHWPNPGGAGPPAGYLPLGLGTANRTPLRTAHSPPSSAARPTIARQHRFIAAAAPVSSGPPAARGSLPASLQRLGRLQSSFRQGHGLASPNVLLTATPAGTAHALSPARSQRRRRGTAGAGHKAPGLGRRCRALGCQAALALAAPPRLPARALGRAGAVGPAGGLEPLHARRASATEAAAAFAARARTLCPPARGGRGRDGPTLPSATNRPLEIIAPSFNCPLHAAASYWPPALQQHTPTATRSRWQPSELQMNAPPPPPPGCPTHSSPPPASPAPHPARTSRSASAVPRCRPSSPSPLLPWAGIGCLQHFLGVPHAWHSRSNRHLASAAAAGGGGRRRAAAGGGGRCHTPWAPPPSPPIAATRTHPTPLAKRGHAARCNWKL
jgi:hypothetical protein